MGLATTTAATALLPPVCVLCALASDLPGDLCSVCAADMPALAEACPRCAMPAPRGASGVPCGRCQRRPPILDGVHARCRWGAPADALVLQLKFAHRTPCARVIADLMAEAPPPVLSLSGACLVPVPLHWRRRWSRGFDQAALIARHLQRMTGAATRPRLLAREKNTLPRAGLTAHHRRRGMRGAFRVRGVVPEGPIVLIDDVLTTGTTLSAAAAALRTAGARSVHGWVFARSTARPAP